MNARLSRSLSGGTSACSAAGAKRLKNSDDAAALRLWHSSPMCSACAMSGFISTGPSFFRPACSTGPRTSAIHFRRSMTSLPLAPKRSTLPRPSFMFE